MRSLVALLLFCGVALAQTSQPAPNANAPANNSAQQPAPDKRGTQTEPFIVKVLPAQESERETEKKETQEKKKAEIDEKIAFETQRIADYTDRLAFFTIALFVVAVLQALLFGVQLKLARDEINRSKQAFIEDRRAWLSIDKVSLQTPVNYSPNGASIRLRVEIKNIGRTPAVKIEVLARACLSRQQATIEQQYEAFLKHAAERAATTGAGILFPDQPTFSIPTVVISHNELNAVAISVGTARVFNGSLFVAVTYHFQSGSLHQTGAVFLLPTIPIQAAGSLTVTENELDFAPFFSGSAT